VSDAALSTVQNAARVLKAFLGGTEQLGPSELGRRLGLGKSTVHRLLATLTAEGLIEQDPRTGGYRLGIVMFELGEAVRIHMDLHTAAAPVLAMLREETRETAQVGVLDRGEVVYVDRLESSHSLRLFTETGRRVPAHCTSSGKVLLGFLPGSQREALLSAAPLAALTPDTITDPARLRVELATVRARGWAEAVNEREIGVASIAAPVRNSRGEVVAAISIGAPLVRLGAAQRRRFARAVTEAGDAVSRRLGWSSETDRRAVPPRHGRADDPRLSGTRKPGSQEADAVQPDRRQSDEPMGELAHADR
jgi:DNA-binding IclR family transcriptional regulator